MRWKIATGVLSGWQPRATCCGVPERDTPWLRHADPQAKQTRERVTHKCSIRWWLGELRFRPGNDLVDEGIKRFLSAVAKVGSLGKNARGTPGREVLFPLLNTNVY